MLTVRVAVDGEVAPFLLTKERIITMYCHAFLLVPCGSSPRGHWIFHASAELHAATVQVLAMNIANDMTREVVLNPNMLAVTDIMFRKAFTVPDFYELIGFCGHCLQLGCRFHLLPDLI